MNDYHGRYFGMMDKDQKSNWRKKIKQHVPKLFDVAGDYEKKKVLLTGELAELMKNKPSKQKIKVEFKRYTYNPFECWRTWKDFLWFRT